MMVKYIYILFFTFLFIGFHFTTPAQSVGDLLERLNESKSSDEKVSLYTQIGLLYQKEKAYSKATEYFLQAKKYIESDDEKNSQKIAKEISILEYLGTAQSLVPDYQASIQTYEILFQKQKDSPEKSRKNLNILADLHKKAEQYQEALVKYEDILSKYPSNTNEQTIQTYNNIGFLYRQAGNNQKAKEYLNKALDLAKKSNLPNPLITTLFNVGVTNSSNGNHKEAQNNFQEALSVADKNNLVLLTAEAYNYLGANYWLQNKSDNAIESVQNAIKIAQPQQADEMLMVSYQLLSEIYQQKGELKESQKAYKKYEEIKNKRIEKVQKDEKTRLENQLNIEKKENEIKELMSEKDKQSSALRQSQLEKQKQEQELVLKERELDLYKSNKDRQTMQLANQLLEQKRVEQMLEITKRKLQEDKQTQEIDKLASTQRFQTVLIKQRELERTKEIQLSEKDKKIKEQQLKDEKIISYYYFWVFVLFGFCLFLTLVGFIHTFWSNRKLKKQRKRILEQKYVIENKSQEILTQNEELQQNQEEIMTQRDLIQDQNKKLEGTNQKLVANEDVLKKSLDKLEKSQEEIKLANLGLAERDRQITSSINAAIAIQTAVLPYKEKLDNLLKQYFIFYKPKDMVSGDFYWLNELDDHIFLAAVDCTGHGVPGAFMSLIANNLLDKIIRVWKIYEPEEILERMHEEIQILLRQKETENNSGMDIGLMKIKQKENSTDIWFAGARRPMYYILPETLEINELKGDRKSIGGFQREEKFITQYINLPKNTTIYVGSDGLSDQNDAFRKRLGEKRLKKILIDISHLEMEKQRQELEEMLQKHTKNTTQRDDILWIGIKI